MALREYQNVIVEIQDGIAWVTLNRPEKRNAMSPALNDEMVEVLSALEGDEASQVLVLTGAGESFSAGMDLKEYFRDVDQARRRRACSAPRGNATWHWRQAADLPEADHRHGQRLVLRRRVHAAGVAATSPLPPRRRRSGCRKSTGASSPAAW